MRLEQRMPPADCGLQLVDATPGIGRLKQTIIAQARETGIAWSWQRNQHLL
jgi:hypothetical protein